MVQVLVVDDDEYILRALAVLLKREYEVICCQSGPEALERLRDGARPAVILVDDLLGEMSGSDFRTTQLQDPALKEIPAVLMTGRELPPNPRLLGFNETLAKPFSADELLSLLNRYAPVLKQA